MRNKVDEKIGYAKIGNRIYTVLIKGVSAKGNYKCFYTCVKNDTMHVVRPDDMFFSLTEEQQKILHDSENKMIEERRRIEEAQAEEQAQKEARRRKLEEAQAEEQARKEARRKEALSALGLDETADEDTITEAFIASVKAPTFDQFKEALLDKLKKEGVRESLEELLRKVFNPKSNYYHSLGFNGEQVDYPGYDGSEICSHINEVVDLYGHVFSNLNCEMDNLVYDLYYEMNPTASDLFDDDFMVLADTCDFPDETDPYSCREQLEEKFWDYAETEEFKNFILGLAD